jgi:hypothetical protein
MRSSAFRPHALVCGLLVGLASSVALSERLDLDRVPAGAVWMMHADLDAAREATVMRRMYERIVRKHPQVENMANMVLGLAGMDPRKDLHDVTVYGLDTDKKNAVMIVHADTNRAFLEKMVGKARDHKTMQHRGYELHTWTHKGWKGHRGEPVVGAFFKDDMLVFARTADQVEQAIDVLDGKAARVGSESPLAGRTRPGSILVARASKIDPETKCPVLRQGQGFRVAMGENEGKSFYRAQLDMDSEAAAQLAQDVAVGMAATVALGLGDQEGVMKLIEQLEATTRGNACLIAWDAAADDVWEVADAMAEKIEAKIEASMKAKRKSAGGANSCGCNDCGCRDCSREGCSNCESGTCPLGQGKDATPSVEAEEKSDPRRPFRDDEF